MENIEMKFTKEEGGGTITLSSLKQGIQERNGSLSLSEGTATAQNMVMFLQKDIKRFTDKIKKIKKGNSGNNGGTGRLPVAVTLSYMVKREYGFKSVEEYLTALGIDKAKHTLSFLEETSGVEKDYNFLIPELIAEALYVGLGETSTYEKAVSRILQVPGMDYTLPFVEGGSIPMTKVREGETIPLSGLKFSQKKTSLYKVGAGINFTYEIIRQTTIELLPLVLKEVAIQISYAKMGDLVKVALNGDQADNSQASAVVGVETANAISYKDLVNVIAKMTEIKRSPSMIITNHKTYKKLLEIPEIKGYDGGFQKLSISTTNPSPTSLICEITSKIDDDKIILIDTKTAFMGLQNIPLMVEEHKDPQSQKISYFLSYIFGTAVTDRWARVVINLGSTTITFPDWFGNSSNYGNTEKPY